MSLGVWYWLLLVIALIFGLLPQPPEPRAIWFRWGGSILLFALLFLLGLAEFGGPLKG